MEDEIDLDLSKTYIFDGTEYNLTGRTAKKDSELGEPRRRRRSRLKGPSKPDIMVEITPAPRKSVRGVSVPNTLTKELQWVKYSELYVVEDPIADDYWEPEQDDESTDSSS